MEEEKAESRQMKSQRLRHRIRLQLKDGLAALAGRASEITDPIAGLAYMERTMALLERLNPSKRPPRGQKAKIVPSPRAPTIRELREGIDPPPT